MHFWDKFVKTLSSGKRSCKPESALCHAKRDDAWRTQDFNHASLILMPSSLSCVCVDDGIQRFPRARAHCPAPAPITDPWPHPLERRGSSRSHLRPRQPVPTAAPTANEVSGSQHPPPSTRTLGAPAGRSFAPPDSLYLPRRETFRRDGKATSSTNLFAFLRGHIATLSLIISSGSLQMHQPGIEPGSHRWQRCILPLDH